MVNGLPNGAGLNTQRDPTLGPLYGALDRFAQFFIAPLFLDTTLDRELRAVDSENKKNLQSDNWRLSQLHKSLSNPKHPYHHFSTGNLQTLRDEPLKRGVQIRKEFMKFHEKHYSANRMKLVVLGREPLDVLEGWVSELFADVRNKDLAQNRWDNVSPFAEEDKSTEIFAKPVMESRSVEIYFPYRDEEDMYESQPSRYLSHLVGHEGPGSILSYIKEKGWANGLSAGGMPICPGSAFFTISIRLTPEGLKHYHEVVEVVFEYISLMKESPPQQWIFDEMKNMAEVDFKFKQKSPASRFTSRLSSVMQKPLPRHLLLSGESKITKFDPKAIVQGMQYLRADNFRLLLVSQDYPGGWDKKEKWYGTDYKVEKISTDFASDIGKALQKTSKDRLPTLHLPHKNEFIPTRLTVEKKEVNEPAKAPKLIRDDEGMRVWWKKDDRFWVPKANVHINLRNPLVYATPANYVKTRIFCELVKDALVEYSYDAEISGLDYHLGATVFGLDVSVSGYNDKMAVLLDKVLVSMRGLQVKQERFDVIKERLMRGYKNWDFGQPYYQVGDFTRWLGSEKSWINDHFAAELPHIEAEDVAAFFPQILEQSHLEILAHGNLYKEDALKMTNLVESTLKSRPLPQSQWHLRRNLILPPGSDFTFKRTLKDPANVNHCLEYYLFVGSAADRALKARLQLFSQLTEESAFDQLRTKEQLGYVVWSGTRMAATSMGYRVIIQSERTAEYLESRINTWLAKFATTLQDMSHDEFEGHKRSLINKRLEKLKNLDSESGRFWSHIGSEYFDFYQVDNDVASLRPLTKEDMVTFYKHFVDPTSTERAKLSVHMIAQGSAEDIAATSSEEQRLSLIEALSEYLGSAGLKVDDEKLRQSFEQVDVASGDQDSILSAVRQHVSSELPTDKVDTLIEQGRQVLGSVLMQLGVKTPAGADHAVNGTEVSKTPTKPTTIIENVHDWKASLEVSAGPSPVADLSEFEEVEPKL